eukprot:CAMPEP_0183293112 /NCGR_PEP_ID=MMETSP0160_2-20130417/1926_1 /TAXON_ID=2839 ORGANISM="Odontella Sinensis, Strain Grunow 1884" /NCGR_SAMPLE_ID=MMETSP0160_2 /ASSEMBLY_ACC=CAM_ASM_000250 /LENGTH=170 /DNA_ID=CAMNT_0025454173 /DNA_START=147 /DNA_END=659 /DNA_ORIENTATION=+
MNFLFLALLFTGEAIATESSIKRRHEHHHRRHLKGKAETEVVEDQDAVHSPSMNRAPKPAQKPACPPSKSKKSKKSQKSQKSSKKGDTSGISIQLGSKSSKSTVARVKMSVGTERCEENRIDDGEVELIYSNSPGKGKSTKLSNDHSAASGFETSLISTSLTILGAVLMV